MPTFAISGNPAPFIIYGGSTNCCYTTEWDLYLTATITTTITDLYFDPINNTCPTSVLEVNGQIYTSPLSTPISLSFGQVIKLKISVCPCVGVTPPTNVIYWGLTVAYTGILGSGTEDIFGVFQETNPQAAPNYPINPAFASLNLYPCETGSGNCTDLLTGTIPFTNYSNFDLPVIIDDGGNFPIGTVYYVDGVAQVSNILFVPKNSTVQLGFGFCWPNSIPTNFDIDVILCDVYTKKITIYINPVYCLGCGINCLGFDIETESSYLPTVSAGCGYGLPNVYTESAVGEYKTLVFHYSYNYGFTNANVDIYFNPYLFTDIASTLPIDPYTLTIPNVGWHKKVQGFMIGGGLYSMQQVTQNQYRPNQQNWEVNIEIINANEFKIFFSFYIMMDIDNGITNTYLENFKRLLHNNIYAVSPNDFITFGDDVYKSTTLLPRFFAKEILLVDNNVNDPNSQIERPFRCYFYDSFPMVSRWYNKGIGLTASEFLTPTFYFYRNNVPWTANFSIFDKTQVTFVVDIPPAYTVSNMVAYIINVNEFDNSVDFKTNYDFSRANITTVVGPAVIDNLIEAPSVQPTIQGAAPSGGDYWSIEFTVGAANVVSTGQYLIGIIVYDNANQMVNTFCYPDLTDPNQTYIGVDTVPSEDSLCCPLNIQSDWSDYLNVYSNVYPHITTYKQRLKNTLVIDGGLFSSNCLFGNFGYNKDWIDLIADVQLRVYSKRPALAGRFYQFMYGQYQSIYNTGYSGNFNNLSTDFTVQDLGGSQLQISWEGRPRWENWVAFPSGNVYNNNPLSPYTLNNIGPVSGQNQISGWGITMDWSKKLNPTDIGGEILFDYIIKFDLTSVLGLPNNQPFYLNKLIQQSLWVFPEEPLATNTQFGTTFGNLFNPLYLEGWDGSIYIPIIGPICPGQYEHVRAILIDLSGSLAGYVIGFYNKPPYGIVTLQEDDETGISGNGFTQLDSQYIYDVTTGVQVGTWEFKVDVNALPPGNYELCAMFIPL